VTLLQFAENLSDRRAAEAVRSHIDWKYLPTPPQPLQPIHQQYLNRRKSTQLGAAQRTWT
jgi:hypothetical protein